MTTRDDQGPRPVWQVLLLMLLGAGGTAASFVATFLACITAFQSKVGFLLWIGFAMFILVVVAFVLARAGSR
jgi:hypothetical protein